MSDVVRVDTEKLVVLYRDLVELVASYEVVMGRVNDGEGVAVFERYFVSRSADDQIVQGRSTVCDALARAVGEYAMEEMAEELVDRHAYRDPE